MSSQTTSQNRLFACAAFNVHRTSQTMVSFVPCCFKSVLFHLWKRNSVNGCQEPGEVALLAAGVEVLSQCVVRQPTFRSLFEPHIAIFTCVEVSLKYRVLLGNVVCPMDPAVAVNVAEKKWACCSFHCHWLREQPSDVLFVKFC